MKILIISTTFFTRNGISTFIINTLKNIDLLNNQVDLVIPQMNNLKNVNSIQFERVNKFVLRRNNNPFGYFYRLYKIIKNNSYDIVHVNGNSCTMAVELMAAKLAGVDVRIAHSHNTTCDHKILNCLLRPLFEFSCNGRYACSEDAGKWLFKKKNFSIIKNGIELNNYSYNEQTRIKVRENLKLKQNDFLIGNVGAFNEQKNQKFLIDLMKYLNKDNRKIKLILIGDGPNLSMISKLIDAEGLKNNVILTGAVNNVKDFLMAIDLFLLPSLFEGLPFSILEAESTGLPCVVSKNVSKELNITGNIQYISLEEKGSWIETIKKIKKENRIAKSFSNRNLLQKKGYDSKVETLKLLDSYKKLIAGHVA